MNHLKKIRAYTSDHRIDLFHSDVHTPQHQEEKTMNLRGKIALDLPSLTGPELMLIRACGNIRKFLTDGKFAEEEDKRMVKQVKAMAKSCLIHEGALYKRRKKVIVRLVAEMQKVRKEAIKEAHDGNGHRGIESTLALIGGKWWFPMMEKLVARYIARCPTCQCFAKPHSLDNPNYQVDIHDVFSHWSIDNAGPFPTDEEGYRYVLIAVDHLSRWAEILPTKTASSVDAANFLYYHIVCRYGMPQSIQSDNGAEFVNEIIERLTNILKIHHRFSTPYYSQSNGRVERTIGSIKTMMTKCMHNIEKHEDGYLNWVPFVYTALYVYRASPHHATGVSPSFLILGENIRLSLHYQHAPPPPKDQVTHKQQILNRVEYMRTVIPGLRSSHYQFAVNREGHKVLVRPTKYKVGELVLIRNYKKKNKSISSPFESPWVGPYRIHSLGDKSTYRLQTIPPPDSKKHPGLLKKLLNWSRLRCYLEDEDDEFIFQKEEEVIEKDSGAPVVDIEWDKRERDKREREKKRKKVGDGKNSGAVGDGQDSGTVGDGKDSGAVGNGKDSGLPVVKKRVSDGRK